MAIKAIAFDVFGTLVQISCPKRPFRKLLRRASCPALKDHDVDRANIMRHRLNLRESANFFRIKISENDLVALDDDLTEELASIRLFDDVGDAFSDVRRRGLKLAICSNLASPYGPAAAMLLPDTPDFHAWSYEAKAIKPEPAIYTFLCAGLGCQPNEVLMVGDSLAADALGARAFGMHAVHLERGAQTNAFTPSIATLSELPHLLDRLEQHPDSREV